MSKWQYFAAVVLLIITAATITASMKSCQLNESETFFQTSIKAHEDTVKIIQKVRDSINSTPIPFVSGAQRGKVSESVNRKYGFGIRVYRGNPVRNRLNTQSAGRLPRIEEAVPPSQ